jgi:hypothetical protein
MEHRKQVLIKKEKKKETVMTFALYETIVQDKTVGKDMSHSLMRGLLLSNSEFISLLNKSQLRKLCVAYCVILKGKTQKSDWIEVLTYAITEHTRFYS